MNDDCVQCLLRNDQIIKPDEIPLMTQYIPYRIVRSIGELPCCFFERKLEQLSGVVVYFDLVGFTPIVANHVSKGKNVGVLSDVFRTYYSIVIECIRVMGGSVFQFAGDSILVCFEQLFGESEYANWNRALTAMNLALLRSKRLQPGKRQYQRFRARSEDRHRGAALSTRYSSATGPALSRRS